MSLASYSPEIRFADIDAMGHVNNAVYFNYFEQARIRFFREIIGDAWDWNKQGILVARNEMSYMIPVLFHDKIEIVTLCTHLGNKSFTLKYDLICNGRLYATGASILVCFDHVNKVSMNIPEIWRMNLEKSLN